MADTLTGSFVCDLEHFLEDETPSTNLSPTSEVDQDHAEDSCIFLLLDFLVEDVVICN